MYHKDLEVYKQSISLVKYIYEITNKYPKEETFGLISQMKRAVISIPSNIAEGNARFSDKETLHFVDIALGSIAELDTQLDISKELGYISDESYKNGIEIMKKVQALLIGLRKYLKNKED